MWLRGVGVAGRGRGWRAFGTAAAAVGLLVATVGVARAADPGLDLASVTLHPEDLPAGFAPSDSAASSFTSLAHALAGASSDSPDAQDVNATVLQRTADGGAEFVTFVLVAPLGDTDQAAFDAGAQQATRAVREAVGAGFGDARVTTIEGLRTGISRLGVAISAPDIGLEYRAVAARRGPVLEVIGHAWTEGVTPISSLTAVAALLDARLEAVVGSEAPVFRPAGPLVPVLTTHIPSPLDVSTDPGVVGTNLVLTALALALLAVSSRLATSMLAEHESALAGRLPRLPLVGRLAGRSTQPMADPARRRRRVRAIAALAVVMLFYGVVFSMLEPGWVPWSLAGVWLLVSMVVANALAGMADDLAAWGVARRWGIGASLAVRPVPALVAIVSVGVSRATAVVPGLLFGTPDALRVDEAALDEGRRDRLAMVGLVALTGVGGAAWAATTVTTAMGRAGELVNGLAGIEALLLLVFAAVLQNLFVILVGAGSSAGTRLRTHRPRAWVVALAIVTFLFFHTLLNPQGDPATVLANRNVQVVAGLVGTFSAVVLAAWGILRLGRRDIAVPSVVDRSPSSAPAPGPTIAVAPPALPGPVRATLPAAAAAWPGWPGTEITIATADPGARGPASFRVADGWVVAITRLVDARARRQLNGFVILSGLAWLVPLVAAVAIGPPRGADAFVGAFLAIAVTWVAVVVVVRLGLERFAVAHTSVFPVGAATVTPPGRDWSVGCALSILLTTLVGLLYLALARGRVVRVVAPLAGDCRDAVALRLKGDEALARHLGALIGSRW